MPIEKPSPLSSLASNPADHDRAAPFRSIPWCRRLLDDKDYKVVTQDPRQPRYDGSTRGLIRHTLNNASTIEHFIALYKGPTAGSLHKYELRVLLTLNGGLDGWVGVCHGGVTATILDEIMSMLAQYYAHSHGKFQQSELTADLHVKFLRAVPTPSTMLVRAWMTSAEGRKMHVASEMKNAEGEVLATATSLFILSKGKL
ncbi:hypothetical protein H2200_000398 [Cladophialophora chaetospira]|uniref:Thioesterase domain-containing protein n=1 Tax=Cladophialophora chaetospira TaxID=386627 RepID=A0AA38XPD6_9EURO|nr:hypothetical protein H2200_000398 [Cladophialophora chaetospira]